MQIHQLRVSWLKNTNFWFLATMIFSISCGQGPPESLPEIDPKFRTTPPSRIYFKNIRSTAYQWEQDPNSRTGYYLLRKIGKQTNKPALYPVIADIWMEDQAQLILKSGRYDTIPTPVRIFWEGKNDSGVYPLDTLDASSMYNLSLQVYEAIRSGHKLEISFAGTPKMPLFNYSSDKSNFSISMQDYLRLTEYY